MESIKSNLSYFTKLSGVFAGAFVKSNLLGGFSTIIVFIAGLIKLSTQVNVGTSSRVSALPFVAASVITRPVGSILLLLVLLLSPFIIYALSSRYALSKAANRLLKDKGLNYLDTLLDRLFVKFKDIQPQALKSGVDWSVEKLKALDSLKHSSENFVTKKLVGFALKKVSLDDAELQQESFSLSDLIKNKLLNIIEDMATPSLRLLWILIGIQWLILLLICFTGL